MRTSTCLQLLVALLLTSTASADWLEVRRPATLKREPVNGSEVLAHLDPGSKLTLVETEQSNGYYHASQPSGQGGWVYRSLVVVHREDGAPTPAPSGDQPAGKLEIHVLHVGQADAILIRCPDGDHELLIDAADTRYPDSSAMFKSALSHLQNDDNRIEVVVATHPHADHIGNMAWVLNTYPVGLYVDDGVDYNSATYRNVNAALQTNGARYWSGQDELVPDLDFCPRADVDARMLRPRGFGHDHDPNNNSVVVRVDYGATSLLFVGDAEREEEQLLLDDSGTRALLDCDFLKVGHHGSDTSSGRAFLDAVSPKLACISCGEKGVGTNAQYLHPRAQTIQELLSRVGPRAGQAVTIDAFDGVGRAWTRIALDKAVYETAAEGELVFESDGAEIHRKQ